MAEYTDEEWTALAAKHGFASEQEMWQKLYGGAEGEASMGEIADRIGIGFQTVRRRLEKHGIQIRKRGGDRTGSTPLTEAELDEILKEGIAAASRRLEMPYHQLYRKVRAALVLRRATAKSVLRTGEAK